MIYIMLVKVWFLGFVIGDKKVSNGDFFKVLKY